MGIFNRRPLCLFCGIFLTVAFAAFVLFDGVSAISVILLAVFGIISILLLCASFIIKKHYAKFTTAFLCFFVAFCAFLHSFVFVSLPKSNAEDKVGSHEVLCYIIDREYSSSVSEEYYVKIKSIDGKEANIKANLICDFRIGLNPRDEFRGNVHIEENNSSFLISSGRLLNVYADNIDECMIRCHTEEQPLWRILLSDSGLEIVSNKVTDRLSSILVSLLGKENGLLALGFFTGDRDDMPTEITRDFRRAGVSHLMAVSGSHIAILLGSIEALLRRLYMKKTYRCVIITLLSAVLLFVSGFALSACRSVIMLYFVYVGYLAYEGSDSLTSLFCSIVIIVLVSPFSIADLGMWMSFLATLGLLTAYPVFEEKIPYPKKKKGIAKRLLLLLRESALVALMTVIANAYLLPITWLFFGEISWVSVLSNILLTPLSVAYLISVPLLIMLYKIPFVGYCVKWVTYALGEAILFIVRVCSRLPNATLSLKYAFCGVIVIVFVIGMLVLLTVKLKKKYLIGIPILFAVTAYSICLPITNIFFTEPRVVFFKDGYRSEIFIFEDSEKMSVCDVSTGSAYGYYDILEEFNSSTATEIDNYIFTHYHRGHVRTFELLSKSVIIRNVYLPVPDDDVAVKYANDIWRTAVDCGINIVIYEAETVIEASNEFFIQVTPFSSDGRGGSVVFYDDDESLVYSSPYYCNSVPNYYNSVPKCQTLLIGCHDIDHNKIWNIDTDADNIILTSGEMLDNIKAMYSDRLNIPKNSYYKSVFRFNKKAD